MLFPIILLAIAILVLANPPPPPNLGRWIATALAIVAIIWILSHATVREFTVTGIVLVLASILYLIRRQVWRKA